MEVEDITIPIIACVGNQEVNADETHTYTVQGVEFDPVSTDDNCEVANIENSYNNATTLEGSQLPIGITTIIWTITDNAGNNNTCSFDIVVENYIENDWLSENCVSIYPNPFSNELIIDAEGYNDKISFEIFNAIGEVVFIGHFFEKIILPTSSFTTGIYVIVLEGDKLYEFEKIIKK